jgi:glycosyltransferase involved in cell wall biosynthesis
MRSRTIPRPLRLLQGRARRRLPRVYRDTYGPLFDIDYYLAQVDGLHPNDAIRHYEDSGAAQGLSPSPLFLDSYYRSQYQGVEIKNPVLHYRETGWVSGKSPHPLFAPDWYTKSVQTTANRDSLPDWKGDTATHYLEHGWQQNLAPHPLVCLPYADRLLPGFRRGGFDPLTYLVRKGLSKFRRPHPLYSPDQIWTCLKRNDAPITQEHQLLSFVNWREPYSPSPFFWPDFYLQQYPESATHDGGPWQHFVEVGQFGDFDPNPYFDAKWYRQTYARVIGNHSPFLHYVTHELSQKYNPSPHFDTAHYLKKNPLVRKTGRSPLEHFLEHGRFASAETEPFQAPHYVHQQLLAASEFEPELKSIQGVLNQLAVYNRHYATKVSSHYATLKKLINQPFSVLVAVPFLSRGGADLAACNLIHRLHEIHGVDRVLLALTDSADTASRDWLPSGTRWVCFSHLTQKLSDQDRIRLLQLLFEDYLPTACYNVNSNACWQLTAQSGLGLSNFCKLYAQLFCHDFGTNMKPKGYAVDYLSRTLDHLEQVFFDSHYFRQHIVESLAHPTEHIGKLKTLYQPTKTHGWRCDTLRLLERLGRGTEYRRQVMWAGRLDRQKQPEVLADIARRCPEFDFHVFGTPVLNKRRPLPTFSPNVILHGEYAEFFDLPLNDMDVFLHTSAWDGLPLLLIDVVQAGLPVVAAQVGGVPELIDLESGWPVNDCTSPEAYAERLREVCFTPENIATKLQAGWERIETRHNRSQYAETLGGSASGSGRLDFQAASTDAGDLA